MFTTSATLINAITAVAPITGLNIGSLSDKSTWIAKFKNSATDAQKAEAQSIIENVELPLVLKQPSTSSNMFIGLFTKTETKAISKSNDEDVNDAWLNVLSATRIEPYGSKLANGLAVLVSAGILTQARSDEILTQAKQLADNGCCDDKYTP